jgi:glycosyltransferase involved in cell wall biosynthesis
MKLSVLLPVYNAELYLKEAIDSVLAQSYGDFEFIIINDGSTDNSLRIIKSFSDPRIVLLDQENQGLARSLNNGLRVAQGKFIARMDADDVAYVDRFDIQLKYLDLNPAVKLVGSAIEIIDKDGNSVCIDPPYTGSSFLKKFIKKLGNPFKHPTVIFDREVAIALGGYDEKIEKYFEDYFLWSKIAAKNDIEILKNVLLKYRITPGSIMSSVKNKEFSEFMIMIINKKVFLSEDKVELLRIKAEEVKTNENSLKSYNDRIASVKSNKMNILYLRFEAFFGKNTAIDILTIVKKVRILKRLYTN